MRAIVQSKNGSITRLALETDVLSSVRGKNVSHSNYRLLARNLGLIKEFGLIISNARQLGIPVNTSKLTQFAAKEARR